MLDIIKDIDIDLKRCEDVIRENNYMEIVIAIEELNDKYKDKIKELIQNNNSSVWNYTRKNLENLEYHLRKYKEEIILLEKEKNIDEKLSDLKNYLILGKNLNNDIIMKTINKIEEIYNNKDLNLDEKYNSLVNYLDVIKHTSRELGIFILEIITLILK